MLVIANENYLYKSSSETDVRNGLLYGLGGTATINKNIWSLKFGDSLVNRLWKGLIITVEMTELSTTAYYIMSSW